METKFKIGDKVLMQGGEAEVEVTGICITRGKPLYRVMYWADGVRHEDWVSESECSPK